MFANRAVNFFIYARKHPDFKVVLGHIIRCSYEDIPNPSKLLKCLLKKDECCLCCYNMSILCSYCSARKSNCSTCICCRGTHARQKEVAATYYICKYHKTPDGSVFKLSHVNENKSGTEKSELGLTEDSNSLHAESVKRIRFEYSSQPRSIYSSNVRSVKERVKLEEYSSQPRSVGSPSVESVKEYARFECSSRRESINLYRRIGSGSRFVQIQILEDEVNIKDGRDTRRAVVVFRCADGTYLRESERVIQGVGDVEAEYQTTKAKGGKYVRKGVILTKAGKNLGYIIHLTVDFEVDFSLVKLRDALITTLQVAEKHELKSIAFTSYLLTRINIHRFLQIVGDFAKIYRPICVDFVQLFVASHVFRECREFRQSGVGLKSYTSYCSR